jgi:electron transport complex protein RnfB
MPSLVERIDAALPQTQCTRCGYPDCRAYAQAIAGEGAAINRCPPGGVEGIERLSMLTGHPVLPLDATCGDEGPRTLAVIDEAWCIGCTLCLDACPTDAILGVNKRMHTVVEAHCTGCELCIPVCPVDCIELEVATPGSSGWQAWSALQADIARQRYASTGPGASATRRGPRHHRRLWLPRTRMLRRFASARSSKPRWHGPRRRGAMRHRPAAEGPSRSGNGGARSGQCREGPHHLGWRLHHLHQHALPGDRELVAGLGMQEADVEAGRALPDAARCEAHALPRQPLDGGRQIVDPQADVIERRRVDGGLGIGVERLHEIDLDLEWTPADDADVLVDVFAFALEGARHLQTEHVDPQSPQSQLVEAADGDLLDA